MVDVFSQWAMTTVATQLPMRLVQARIIPINQSTDSKSTKPIAGKLGMTESVAARITKADPGIPCAPLEVMSETSKIANKSCIERSILQACAIKITPRVK